MTKKIIIEMDKEDLIHLVRGTSPKYNKFDNPIVSKCGVYHGGFNEHWEWDKYELDKLTEEELYELYKICK